MKQFLLFIISFFFSLIAFSQVPPPPLFSGEFYTTMYSSSYDFQGNGSVRLFIQNPAASNEMIAIMMGVSDSSDPPPFNKRFTFTAFTDDGGLSWYKEQLFNIRSGFPQTALINSTDYIVQHQGYPNAIKVYADIIFGLFTFATQTPPDLYPNGTWGGIAGNPAGSQLSVFATIDKNVSPFPIYKITSIDEGYTWNSPWTLIPNISGPSGAYSCFASTGGMLGLAGFNYDSMLINLGSSTMYYFKSTNYGATFDSTKIFFQPYYLGGPDTVYHDIETGLQGIYSGSEPHIVFGVYSSASIVLPNNFLAYRHSKILHWSPSTGITTVSNDTNSPAITDSINNTLLAPRCQPSIGRLANGTLVCVFTGLTRGHTQVVDNGQTFVTGDIYISYSSNNGLNWSQPGNFTNTPGIEEKSPSIIPVSSDNIAKVIYFRDMKAGYYALNNAVGKAPYYCILKKSDLTGLLTQNLHPAEYNLQQNYPNPFNPLTNITFSVPKTGIFKLAVYDAAGRETAILFNGELSAGTYNYDFDASQLASGIYFYKLESNDYSQTKKMVLIK